MLTLLLQKLFPNKISLTLQQNLVKFSGLVLGVFMMAVAGSLYTFGTYSAAMKEINKYEQTQINLISSVGNIGVCLGAPAGYVFDRFGPRITMLVAIFATLIGYILMWASVAQIITTHYLFMTACFFVIGQGNIFTYMAALLAQIRNFSPQHRGKVVGVVDAMYGVSAGIYSLVYNLIFNRNSLPAGQQNLSGFSIFMAASVTIVNIGGFLLLETLAAPTDKPSELPEESATEPVGNEDGFPVFTQRDEESASETKADPIRYQSSASEGQAINTSVEETQALIAEPKSEESNDITGLDLFLNVNFWLMNYMFSIAIGVGLVYMNNIGLILESAKKESIGTWVTVVLPLGSFSSRLVSGVVSDLLVAKISRSAWQLVALILMLVSQIPFIFTIENEVLLVVASFVIGSAFGALWCVTPTLVSEMFGVKNFGSNWGNMILFSAIGGFVLQLISSQFYQSYLAAGAITCYGLNCWRYTFVVSSGVSVVAVILGVVVLLKTKQKHQLI